MRMLLFYVRDVWLEPFAKNLDAAPAASGRIVMAEAVFAMIHAEPGDEDRAGKVVTKAIKNLKWVAGKFGSKRAVLHYFAHLGPATASPECARTLLEAMGERLRNADYEVQITPFGYFTEFQLHVVGESMGKVYVEI